MDATLEFHHLGFYHVTVLVPVLWFRHRYTLSGKKDAKCFCKVFYKTWGILMKFGSFLHKFAAKS